MIQKALKIANKTDCWVYTRFPEQSDKEIPVGAWARTAGSCKSAEAPKRPDYNSQRPPRQHHLTNFGFFSPKIPRTDAPTHFSPEMAGAGCRDAA